jgi:hypothetical protein
MIIYPVIAYRHGDTHKHSYTVAVCDNLELAKQIAVERAGKYQIQVFKFTLNQVIPWNRMPEYTVKSQREQLKS